MRGRLTVLALLLGIIFPVSSALAASPHRSTASQGIGIRLVDVPAESRANPLARLYIVDRVAPGASIRRRIEVSNSTSSTADITVYPAAASLRQGGIRFAPGHGRNELSSWTSVSRGVLRLSARTKAVLTVTIKVPTDASSGERYGVIWAEVSARAAEAGGVTLVNRVGVRMYLSVGPGGAPRSPFTIGPLTARRSETGEPLVVATIHNSGRRTLEISGNLTLSQGPGGLRAGPFPVQIGTALPPDESEPATVRLDKRLPRGPWRAQMLLRSGLVQRVAVGTIIFPRHAGATKPPAASSGPDWRRDLILSVAFLVLLAVAALAVRRFWRMRRGGGGAQLPPQGDGPLRPARVSGRVDRPRGDDGASALATGD
jgi:hypothetical protein